MREYAFINKSKSCHEVVKSALLDIKNVSRNRILVIEEGWCSILGSDLRKVTKFTVANYHYIFLQFAQNSIVEVWVVLLLKYLRNFPHFLVTSLGFTLFLLLLPRLFFHGFERTSTSS